MGKKSKRKRQNHNNSSKLGAFEGEGKSTVAVSLKESEVGGAGGGGNSGGDDIQRPAPALRRETEIDETFDNLQFQDPYVEAIEPDDGDEDDDDGEWEDMDDCDVEDIDVEEDGEDTKKTKGEKNARHPTRQQQQKQSTGIIEVIESWNPLTGQSLKPGEQLEIDPSAYKMHHALTPDWPSLSFDFVRDDLGESRTRFPHSLIAAVGTQADQAKHNKLTIMKLSDLSRMPVENEDEVLGEEYNPDEPDNSDDDDDDDDSDEEVDLDPILENYSIPHIGGVNRVRVMPQHPGTVATWSETGKVHLFNIEPILQRFTLGRNTKSAHTSSLLQDIPTKPFFTYNKHGIEGYAMDWSSLTQGHMITGDCHGSIHVWTPRPEGGYSVSPSYTGRKQSANSVEDLQWSPQEHTVFCSAECGGYVRIFDTRAAGKCMLQHQIHNNGADVNVLSWNRLVSNLLATGGDDGVLSVWDLRHFGNHTSADGGDKQLQPLARFTLHKTPITSVEWHPTDESMLAASDNDGTYIYDFSVEEDDTTGSVLASNNKTNGMAVPPQLLFVHSGSEQFKEVHWHSQISSCIMTTARSGFSVFIPSNL